MNETERVARLLCETLDVHPVELEYPGVQPRWYWYTSWADRLTAAGLTLLPLEPDDVTVDEMAAAIGDAQKIGGETKEYERRVARAAYRAATKVAG